jgi:hypothetical protein
MKNPCPTNFELFSKRRLTGKYVVSYKGSSTTTGRTKMFGYFYGNVLIIAKTPYGGKDFRDGEQIICWSKREARKICKARGIKPWNF